MTHLSHTELSYCLITNGHSPYVCENIRQLIPGRQQNRQSYWR